MTSPVAGSARAAEKRSVHTYSKEQLYVVELSIKDGFMYLASVEARDHTQEQCFLCLS